MDSNAKSKRFFWSPHYEGILNPSPGGEGFKPKFTSHIL